jgi:hypothetical protein
MKFINPEMIMSNALHNYKDPTTYKPPFQQQFQLYNENLLKNGLSEYINDNTEKIKTNLEHDKIINEEKSKTESQTETKEGFEIPSLSKIHIDMNTILKLIIILLIIIILFQYFKIENLKTIIQCYNIKNTNYIT